VREHVSSGWRGIGSRLALAQAASRRLATSAFTIALSLLALVGTSLAPSAAAGTPRPDPYPTRAAQIAVTPAPDPAPAARTPPTPKAASPVHPSTPVVTARSVVQAATTDTSTTTSSLHTRQEARPTRKKKTGAESRPATRSGRLGSRSRASPGPAARPVSVPPVRAAAAAADGSRLLPSAIALLALVIASGCLVQLLARSEGERTRV
jgi:hypothetical protein